MATPAEFPEQTDAIQPSGKTYSDNVVAVKPLPVWTDGEQCVSCWKLSWAERLSVLVWGRVWLAVLSGRSQPPALVDGSRTYFKAAEQRTP